MKAACELVKRLKPKKVYVNFIIELKELNGKSVFGDDVEVESVLTLKRICIYIAENMSKVSS